MEKVLNKRRMWQIALLILAAHTCLFILKAPPQYIHNARLPDSPPWWDLIGSAALHNYLWVLITPLVLWVGRRFPITRRNLPRRVFLHLCFGGLSGVIHHFSYWLGMWILGFVDTENVKILFFILPNFLSFISGAITIYALIFAVQQAYLHFRESQERAFRLQQAELEMLKMQLHPHFFFNILNAISALMYRSPKEADRMIVQLGDMFRAALRKDKTQEVSLKEELEFLQAFLQIHQTLMGKRLQIEWEIEPQMVDALVPNLILQPLAENAIQHGLEPLEAGGQITISAKRQNGHLLLQVSDDGQGFVSKNGNKNDGIGLSNTRARLENLYGDKQKFSIDEIANGGVVVKIEIPFREKLKD